MHVSIIVNLKASALIVEMMACAAGKETNSNSMDVMVSVVGKTDTNVYQQVRTLI